MKSIRMSALAILFAAATLAIAADNQEKSLKDTLSELLPGMSNPDEGRRNDPQQQWQEICWKAAAPGNEARREEVCKLMAEKLSPELPAPAKVWLLKQLERIGRGECVEAVAKCLDDKDPLVLDQARRALANNPAPEAGEKLRAKLQATTDAKAKVGLINALAYRAEPASIEVLQKELSSKDQAVACAAARALGKIGTWDAAWALNKSPLDAQGELRANIFDACLLCADKALKQGDADKAKMICAGLTRQVKPNEPVRLAILQCTLNAAGDAAPALVLEVLAGEDADARAVVTGHIINLKGEAIKKLAEGLAKLPPAGQIDLLAALKAKRDPAALSAVLAAAKSEDEAVSAAAYRALAGVADASVVPLLVETMKAGGKRGDAAREALENVFAQGVDEKLVALVQQTKDAGERGRLVELLDRRRAESAVPLLLLEALHENRDVRRRAMGALARLAQPSDMPALVKALVSAKDAGERDEYERVLATVCERVPEEAQKAQPVLALYTAASEADKNVILPVLGRLGGQEALAIVRGGLASNDAARYEAAARALSNWPDTDAAEDMLKLAESGKDEASRVRGLRAFVRVVTSRDDDSPDKKKLEMLKQALKLAQRKEDRSLVIDRARGIRHVETLRMVAPYLDDAELSEVACRTVVELAHHRGLRDPNKAEFTPALEKVIKTTKDNGLKQRADDYLTGRK